MLLLGVKPANTNLLPEDSPSPMPGESIWIEVAWKEGRQEVRRPLAEFVKLSTPARSNRSRDWRYNGSFLVDGAFAAQLGGSIIALITDPSALVNNAWPDRADDEIHQVRAKGLPREGTPVEIILQAGRATARSALSPGGLMTLESSKPQTQCNRVMKQGSVLTIDNSRVIEPMDCRL